MPYTIGHTTGQATGGQFQPSKQMSANAHPYARQHWTDVNNKYQHWLFTHYDVSSANEAKLASLVPDGHCLYIVWGREICPTTNRQHLQGFITFKNQVRKSSVVKYLGDCWCGPMVTKGNTDDCIAYCKKEGNYVEHGTPILTSTRLQGMYAVLGDLQQYCNDNESDDTDELDYLVYDLTQHFFDVMACYDPDSEACQCSYDSDEDMPPAKRVRFADEIDIEHDE